MSPLLRIIARYAIGIATGWAVSKGLLGPELGDQIAGDSAIPEAIIGAIAVVAGGGVEALYAKAKATGGKL